tara:strand:+ start:5485 stop:5802 length:318 start_codon:yes stop_codon:yes gene_type:complete
MERKNFSNMMKNGIRPIYNDSVKNIPQVIKRQSYKGKILSFTSKERLNLLVYTLKEELCMKANNFQVRTIQLFYDDMYEEYLSKKEEDITFSFLRNKNLIKILIY